MSVSVDWGTKVIYVPKSDLGALPTSGYYELDVDWFRLQLKDLEDNEDGMPFPDTHRHVTETTLAGVTYARFVEIINGYTVEFEDGQYSVVCTGANHNISDVKVVNQVSLIIGNAAGLITVETGVSGLTPEESDQLMALPLEADISNQVISDLDPTIVHILELYRVHGLDVAIPLEVTLTQRKAGVGIVQDIDVDVVTEKTTVTRQ